MVFQHITVFISDLFLQALNLFVLEFNDLAGFQTHHVIVVSAVVKFKHGMTGIEMVTYDQAG